MFDCQKVFAKQKALLAIEKHTEGCAVKQFSGLPNNCIVWHTNILLAGYCLDKCRSLYQTIWQTICKGAADMHLPLRVVCSPSLDASLS